MMRARFTKCLDRDSSQKIAQFQLNPGAEIKKLARELGVEVEEKILDRNVRGYVERDTYVARSTGYIIVLNKRDTIEQKRFTVAHELAHIFLRHIDDDIFAPPEFLAYGEFYLDQQKELDCDGFAEDLLMPFRLLALLCDTGELNSRALSEIAKVPVAKAEKRISFFLRNRTV